MYVFIFIFISYQFHYYLNSLGLNISTIIQSFSIFVESIFLGLDVVLLKALDNHFRSAFKVLLAAIFDYRTRHKICTLVVVQPNDSYVVGESIKFTLSLCLRIRAAASGSWLSIINDGNKSSLQYFKKVLQYLLIY